LTTVSFGTIARPDTRVARIAKVVASLGSQ
jgi:hypothetical protein